MRSHENSIAQSTSDNKENSRKSNLTIPIEHWKKNVRN